MRCAPELSIAWTKIRAVRFSSPKMTLPTQNFPKRSARGRFKKPIWHWSREASPAEKGRIELAISRDPRRRVRMAARPLGQSAGARAARTDWSVRFEIGPTTLVEVQLHTGRTHQIRVHFSPLKHPVVGDTLYGAASPLTDNQTTMPVLGRQFLHALRLSFPHPRTGKQITVTAPPAPELENYLEKLVAAAGWSKIDALLAAFL